MEGYLTLAILGGLIFLFALLSNDEGRKVAYWIGLVALYLQALFITFRFGFVLDLASGKIYSSGGPSSIMDEMRQAGHVGVFWGAVLSSVPFILPLILSLLTGSISGNTAVGVVSFPFYSVIQVVVLGMATNQGSLTNRVVTAIKYALPILSFLVSLIRALTAN